MDSTALDQVTSEVPDQMTDDDKLAAAVSTVGKIVAALQLIDDRLETIERAMGAHLPTVVDKAPLGDAVDLMSEIKVVLDSIGGDSGRISAVKSRLAFVREVTMPERFAREKITTFSTDRFRVTKTTNLYASIIPGNIATVEIHDPFTGEMVEIEEPRAYSTLRDLGYGSLIKPTVNASSLSAAAKEIIENGMELPEELFRCHPKTSTSVTKKPKKG